MANMKQIEHSMGMNNICTITLSFLQ